MAKNIIIGLLLVSNLTLGILWVKQIPPKEIIKTSKGIILEGTYVTENNLFYKSLTFRGESTVTIKDGIFGLEFTSSYTKDENLIRIQTDKSDLLLEIKDANTLIGSGFAQGTFKKITQNNSTK